MKQVKVPSRWLLLAILLLLAASGCSLIGLRGPNLSSQEQTQTETAKRTNVSTPDENPGAALETPIRTPTQKASKALTSADDNTQTVTPTSDQEAPMVRVNANTNCRTGPGMVYEVVGVLQVGQQAVVVGQSADWQYWIIQNPEQPGECWLWTYYATVTGSTAGLPIHTPPPTPSPTPTATITPTATPSPTPTPVFDWAGIWSIGTGPPGGETVKEFSMTVHVDGEKFTGSVDYLGNLVTYKGTVSEDTLIVSGTWSDLARGGLFRFYALGANQFQGYSAYQDDRSALCGARAGAGFPSPCYRE